MATDPAKVMQAAIRGIANNKLHVFPDFASQTIHLLKRYFPELLGWISDVFDKKLQNAQLQ